MHYMLMHQTGLFQCPVCEVNANRLGAIVADFEKICWNEARSSELMQTLAYYPVLKAKSVNDFSYDIKRILVYFIEELGKKPALTTQYNINLGSNNNNINVNADSDQRIFGNFEQTNKMIEKH